MLTARSQHQIWRSAPLEAIAELIRFKPDLVWAGEEVRVEVTDERQLVLFTIAVFGIDAPALPAEPPSFRPIL